MSDSQVSLEKAREHFYNNIRQMKNNAVLLRRMERGRMETIFASEDFAEMMECTIEEAMELMDGMGFYKTTRPEDRPLVRSILKHRMAYDGGQVLTIQKTTAKRRSIWCNVHYAFIDDFDEHFVYCTYTDVTARKEYEERMKSVYNNMGQSFYKESGSTLAYMRVNLSLDRFEELKGKDLYETDSPMLPYSESIEKRSMHFPVPTEKSHFLKLFNPENLMQGYAEGKASVSQVLFSIRNDGRSCFVRISASITRHPLTGDTVAFMTEQECNGDKVKETLTGKILAQQFDMVAYLVDGRYGVTIGDEANIGKGSIFPIIKNGNYHSYLMHQVMPLLHGSEDEKKDMADSLSLQSIEEGLKHKEPYVVNVAIEIDGEVFYKQFDFYTVEPEAKFYILLKSDTTEIQKAHRAMNEQLKSALAAANEANIAKTAFLSNMSHEIRTPMNAIIGLDRIAMEDPDLPEKTREYLKKIAGSAQHLLGLINDILDMSRIESGRMSVRHEEFSFSSMLEQINTMINSQCQDKGLSYTCRINGKVDDFYVGDDMKLKQVLINILGNAVKFTPSPGRVDFGVEKVAEFDGQSTIRFVIKDTGIGMDKSYIPKIFDAFSQEDSSRSNKYGSTGLGMAITKNIVELMNGNISVESEKGRGTAFTVNVTLKNSDRIMENAGNVDINDLKVLIIDDESVDLEHARLVLEELGISADTCLGGKEAIETIELKAARMESYNLILVDWKMPEKDGVEVTREIRKISGADSAVIVLTAYHWDDIEKEAVEAGVDGFMSKPLFASNVLPAYTEAKHKKAEKKPEAPMAELKGRRVRLAEDMQINAEIMKTLLSMKGIEADHAENGEAALRLFSENVEGYYDAVLMDVRMPVMDGLKATEAIRTLKRGDAARVPIIAMTANAFDEDVQRSLQAGMNAHLSKPVQPEQLFKTLGELIALSGEPRSLSEV